MRNFKGRLTAAAAILTVLGLITTSGGAIAQSLVSVPGVAEIGTYESSSYDNTESGSSSNGPGQSEDSSDSETCVLPLFGDCLFTFREHDEEQRDHIENATWFYYDRENATRSGYYVDLMDGVFFTRASAESIEREGGEGHTLNRTDYDRTYYENNLGYSEEHIDDEREREDYAEHWSEEVDGVYWDTQLDAPVAGGGFSVGREEGSSNRTNEESAASSRDESDEYFGIPIQENGDYSWHELSEEEQRFWERTLVDGTLFLVLPGDNPQQFELVGLRLDKGEESSSGESASDDGSGSYQRVFGFTVYETEDRKDERHRYALFQEWLHVAVDVANGTVTGGISYERGSSETYDYVYDRSETGVVGIPLFGENDADESSKQSEWRELEFTLDAADGAGSADVRGWEEDSSEQREWEDTFTFIGLPVGSTGSEDSSFHSDGVAMAAAIGGGLLWIEAAYVNETRESSSTTDIIIGEPIVGWSEESEDRSRSVGAGAGSDTLGGGASAGYEKEYHEKEQDIRLFGDDFAGIATQEESTTYDAGIVAPQGLFTFDFRYQKSTSDSSVHVAGFPLGVESEKEDFNVGVAGAAPANVLVYSFEHEETRRDHQLYAGDTDIGRYEQNSTKDRLNIVVLDGLASLKADRSFTDGHVFAGEDTEILDFSGQSAGTEAEVAGQRASTTLFFGYLEFADAIALGLVVAHWCVRPDLPLDYGLLTGTVGTVSPEAQTIAELALVLALFAGCPIPVFAPVPYFLLSPCILVPVAHFAVFGIVTPVATAILPVSEARSLAQMLQNEAGDASWDVYDDTLGCMWLTIPPEARNPQPTLTALDAGTDVVDQALSQVWPQYDAARRNAYDVVDDVFDVESAAPSGTEVLTVAPHPCDDARTSHLCAPPEASCTAAALRVWVAPNDALPSGMDETYALTSADAFSGPTSARHAGDATTGALESECAASDAPYDSACGMARATSVAVDLTSVGVPLVVEASGAQEEGCSLSAASGDNVGKVARFNVSIGPLTVIDFAPVPNSGILLGPLGFVAANEEYVRETNGCTQRHGDALRVVAYDDAGDVAAIVVVGSVSTGACRSDATITPPSVAAAVGLVPGSLVQTSVDLSGAGPTPTGTVRFLLCQPSEITSGGCETGGAQVGSTKTLDANGTATSDATDNTRLVGTYCWRVEYMGDEQYLPGSRTDASASCFATERQPLALTVSADTPATTPGEWVRGRADAAIAPGAPSPTAPVTFHLCAPGVSTSAGCPTSGTVVGGATPFNVSDVAISVETNETVVIGTFCWRATFPGDAFYLPGTATNGGAACFETGRVAPQASASATPTGGAIRPGTSAGATLSLAGIGNQPTPTGSVTFHLCGPAQAVAGVGCPSASGTQIGGPVALVGGHAASSATTSTMAIGLHCWRAEYGGDAFFVPLATTSANLCFETVRQDATAAVEALVGAVPPLAPGVATQGRATITGDGLGPAPTGGVTFYLCAPSDATLVVGCLAPAGASAGAPATVSGGIATSALTSSALALGRHCWRAVYAGDAYYLPTETTNNASACFTTQRVASSVLLNADAPTTILPGDAVTATATIAGGAGTATGRVQFFLCTPANVTASGCEPGFGQQIGEARDLSGGVATSNATNLTFQIGTYCWRANFTGDLFYFASSATNAGSACFTVNKPSAIISLESIPNGNEIVPGTAVFAASAYDIPVQRYPVPTGSATFWHCTPAQVTAIGCASPAGTQVGGAVNVENATADSITTTSTLTHGKHCFRVEYAGDAFYAPGMMTNPTDACFTVSLKTPLMESYARPGGSVAVDAVLNDTALLFGGNGLPIPTGSVSFHLCTPAEVVTPGVNASWPGCHNATGTQIGPAIPLDANGIATSQDVPSYGNDLGYAVAAGSTFYVLGAPGNDTGGFADAGSAYLIESATGRLIATLDNPNPAAYDRFGYTVAVAGSYVVVGAPYDDDLGATDGGRAFVFHGTTGAFVTTLDPLNPTNYDRFSSSLAGVGSYVAVGIPYNDTNAIDSGAVMTFYAPTGGWVSLITNPTPASSDYFGYSLGSWGGYLLVGAPYDDYVATNAGRAYRYSVTGGLYAYYSPPTPTAYDYFGWSVGQAGSYVAVGILLHDGAGVNAGAVQTFFASGSAVALIPNPAPVGGTEYFGWRVAAAGSNLAVAAPYSSSVYPSGGIVQIVDPATGAHLATITNATPNSSARFGYDLASYGNNLVIGAPYYDAGTTNGAAYLHDGTSYDLVRTTVNLQKGIHCWRAEYSGDSLYLPLRHTNFDTECFIVSRDPGPIALPFDVSLYPSSEISTALSIWDVLEVPLDFKESAPAATGTVAFYVCAPSPTPPSSCPSGGTHVGNSTITSNGLVTSPAYSPSVTGQHCWRAEYLGDAFYLPANYASAAEQCFNVKHAASLSLSASPSGDIGIATAPGASLTVGPAPLQPTPTGAATFWLCAPPREVSDGVGCDEGDGTQVGAPVALSAGQASAPSVPTFGDGFGASGARVAGRLAIGAPLDGAGVVHLFDESTGGLLLSVPAPSATPGARFGASLAALGGSLFVGAPGENRVYELDATTGALLETYVDPSGDGAAEFGAALAAVGSRVAIGAPGTFGGAGRAYLHDAGTAALVATLADASPAADERFGATIATFDADFVVGAPNAERSGVAAGLAHRHNGTTGALVVTYQRPFTYAAGDGFGSAIAQFGDHVVIGAPGADVSATDGGALYRVNATTANFVQTYSPPTPQAGSRFGASLAALGSDLVVGAPAQQAGLPGAGSAFLVNGTSGASATTYVNPRSSQNANFGSFVLPVGTDVLVGAPNASIGVGAVGAAFLLVGNGPTDLDPSPGGGEGTTSGTFDGETEQLIRTFGNLEFGLHCWRATYAGDALYLGDVTTAWTGACFDIKRDAAIQLDASGGANAIPGAPATATILLSGPAGHESPFGNVTFALCKPAQVTAGVGCAPGDGTVIGGMHALTNISGGFAVSDLTSDTLTLGTYCWRAMFAPDAGSPYLAAAYTDDGDACFTVTKQAATLASAANPGGSALPAWTPVRAAVAAAGAGPTPTGLVTYWLCAPAEVTPGVGCASPDGTQVGGAVALASGSALSSATTSLLGIGKHCWRIEYAGDGAYFPASHTDFSASCFTTALQPATLGAVATPGSDDVAPWAPASAAATAYGAGPVPTGNVAFYLCAPTEVVPAAGCPMGSGTQVGAAVALDAGGSAAGDATSTLLALGAHCWRAEYAGDGAYLPTTYTDATGACFTTTKQSALATLASSPGGDVVPWIGVTSTATLDGGAGAPTPTGVARFYLCDPGNVTLAGCESASAPQVGAHVALVNGSATSEPTSFTLPLGTHCWRVEYSGDSWFVPGVHTGAASECFTVVSACPNAALDSLGASIVRLPNGDVVVGLPGNDAGANGTGVVCVFDGATGDFERVLANPATRAEGDAFGSALALVGDLVVVGAPGNDTVFPDSGRAYAFDAMTGDLAFVLENPTPGEGDAFGASIANVGGIILVGAPSDDTGATDAGAAYAFNATSGELMRALLNPAPDEGDAFGFSLGALGTRALVGTPYDDGGGTDAGAAYAIDLQTGALTRSIFQYDAGAHLGWSVTSFGGHILVGAPDADLGGFGAGAAYLFNGTSVAPAPREPNQTYSPQDALDAIALSKSDLLMSFTNPTGATGDAFGAAVVALDATRVAIGAPGASGGEGRVLVFQAAGDAEDGLLDGLGTGLPGLVGGRMGTLLRALSASVPDANARFGQALVAALGGELLVGAPADDAFFADAGAVHLMDADDGATVIVLGGAGA